MASLINFRKYVLIGFLLLCSTLHASFIEQTMGTAVVKDATALYFNPAALTISPHQQFILLGTLARAQFEFSGSAQKYLLGVASQDQPPLNPIFSCHPCILASL